MAKPKDPTIELQRVARRLEVLDRQRLSVLQERDRLVDECRSRGMSWVAISALTGCTRQALMKRVPAPPSTSTTGAPLF